MTNCNRLLVSQYFLFSESQNSGGLKPFSTSSPSSNGLSDIVFGSLICPPLNSLISFYKQCEKIPLGTHQESRKVDKELEIAKVPQKFLPFQSGLHLLGGLQHYLMVVFFLSWLMSALSLVNIFIVAGHLQKRKIIISVSPQLDSRASAHATMKIIALLRFYSTISSHQACSRPFFFHFLLFRLRLHSLLPRPWSLFHHVANSMSRLKSKISTFQIDSFLPFPNKLNNRLVELNF